MTNIHLIIYIGAAQFRLEPECTQVFEIQRSEKIFVAQAWKEKKENLIELDTKSIKNLFYHCFS